MLGVGVTVYVSTKLGEQEGVIVEEVKDPSGRMYMVVLKKDVTIRYLVNKDKVRVANKSND
jgi:hypothetical protein